MIVDLNLSIEDNEIHAREDADEPQSKINILLETSFE